MKRKIKRSVRAKLLAAFSEFFAEERVCMQLLVQESNPRHQSFGVSRDNTSLTMIDQSGSHFLKSYNGHSCRNPHPQFIVLRACQVFIFIKRIFDGNFSLKKNTHTAQEIPLQ